ELILLWKNKVEKTFGHNKIILVTKETNRNHSYNDKENNIIEFSKMYSYDNSEDVNKTDRNQDIIKINEFDNYLTSIKQDLIKWNSKFKETND
ncbi:11823_t:CDS:1, partial [Dentiscutata erythropus]